MNPDAFNMSIRTFLKMVGVHSQREIEAAIERGMAAGKLQVTETLPAKMKLTLGAGVGRRGAAPRAAAGQRDARGRARGQGGGDPRLRCRGGLLRSRRGPGP